MEKFVKNDTNEDDINSKINSHLKKGGYLYIYLSL